MEHRREGCRRLVETSSRGPTIWFKGSDENGQERLTSSNAVSGRVAMVSVALLVAAGCIGAPSPPVGDSTSLPPQPAPPEPPHARADPFSEISWSPAYPGVGAVVTVSARISAANYSDVDCTAFQERADVQEGGQTTALPMSRHGDAVQCGVRVLEDTPYVIMLLSARDGESWSTHPYFLIPTEIQKSARPVVVDFTQVDLSASANRLLFSASLNTPDPATAMTVSAIVCLFAQPGGTSCSGLTMNQTSPGGYQSALDVDWMTMKDHGASTPRDALVRCIFTVRDQLGDFSSSGPLDREISNTGD